MKGTCHMRSEELGSDLCERKSCVSAFAQYKLCPDFRLMGVPCKIRRDAHSWRKSESNTMLRGKSASRLVLGFFRDKWIVPDSCGCLLLSSP
jgi:hypothetical protein